MDSRIQLCALDVEKALDKHVKEVSMIERVGILDCVKWGFIKGNVNFQDVTSADLKRLRP